MGVISYEVPINVQRMTIGVQGENNVREFLFDVTEWRQITGDIGTAEMVIQRRGDSSPYAAVITMHDENTVSWIPKSADTAKAGAGKIQLMWIANGKTVKTKIFDMKVDPSLDYAVPDTSLDPWASWMPGIINADANYKGLTNRVDDIQQRQTSPYNFKGAVATLADLPSTGQEVNDTYYVEAVKYRVTWTGEAWQQSSMDESDYEDELAELWRKTDGNLVLGPIVANEYVTLEGEIKPYAGWSRTGYLDVSKAAELRIRNTVLGSEYNAFFDENKTFISAFTLLTTETIVAVPENAKYVVLSNNSSRLADTIGLKISRAEQDVKTLRTSILNVTPSVPLVPDGTDYDTLTTPGTYKVERVSSASTMGNCPTKHPHKILVMALSQMSYFVQMVFDANNGDIFLRQYNGEAFSAWRSVATADDLQDVVGLTRNQATVLPDGTDYDTLGVGQYVCTSIASAKTMVHCPVTVGHRVIVMETYAGNSLMMFLVQNRKVWFRYNTEDWQTWAVEKSDLPEYYVEHIEAKEAIALERICAAGNDGDSFAIVTDTHWGKNAKNSPTLVRHIAQATPINRLMMLGDYYITQPTRARALKELNTVLGAFKGLGMDLYIIPGNHDYNHGTQAGYPIFTESEIYGQIMTGQYSVTADGETCSFWADNPTQKVRYFFTTCMHDSSYNKASYHWVLGQMRDVPDGYSIIIFTHTGLNGTGSWSHEYAQYLTGALLAIRNHSSFTFDGVPYDYSAVNATPIAVISGHQHRDEIFADHNIACIQIDTDAYQYTSDGYNREAGTIGEQVVDMVTANLALKTLFFTRVGAGGDRIIHYAPTVVSSGVSLRSELDGTLTWESDNTSVATVSSGGVVSGVGAGCCTVRAKDDSGNEEIWVVVT